MTENPIQTNKVSAPVLPELKSLDIEFKHNLWKVFYYQEFAEVLLEDNGALKSELIEKIDHLLSKDFSDFRQQLIIKGVPVLMGLFYTRKEVRFYSPRLGRELFLVEQLELNRAHSLLKNFIESESYCEFKDHAELVAGLDGGNFPSVIELTTHENSLEDLLNDKSFDAIESKSQSLVDRLLVYLNAYNPSTFEKMSDFGLDMTARFALLRIHLLKFLAILPSLDHDSSGKEVKRILLESLRRLLSDNQLVKKQKRKGQERPLPTFYITMIRIVFMLGSIIPAGLLAGLVRYLVRFMAKRFIAGEKIEEVENSFQQLFKTGRDLTLDQLGELVVSEKEADQYCDSVLKLVNGLGQHIPKGQKNGAEINRAHVSIKVSALCSDFRPQAFEATYRLVSPRLKKILLAAKEKEVFINIDAEHFDYRDIVFQVYQRVLLETPELSDYQQTGIVLQAYLRDAGRHLDDIICLAKKRKLAMPLRLVKGAYWDAETVEADAHSFDAPEYLNKEETDLNFRQMAIKIFQNWPNVQLCLASHNFSDHCFVETLRSERFDHTPLIEHQCLHMTYESLSVGMAQMGWNVRNYVPVGNLLVGMAYLVRRIMENSSQVGVLALMRGHKKKGKIATPVEVHREKKDNKKLKRDLGQGLLTSDFFNITAPRLYIEDEREALQTALEVFKEIGLERNFPNAFITKGELTSIHSSSDPELCVGRIAFADREDAKRAAEVSEETYNRGDWSNAHWITRSSILLKAADILLVKRNELASLITYEAGKSVIEALGDVDEAIDFLSYYAREERKIFVHGKNQVSRGPIVSITPWNFPLAIPAGMVVAPLVAGNTVILKSAEQTPLIAQELVNILHRSGIPQDVLIHLPGLGEVVGDELVNSLKIAGYVFTGSKAVGTMIAHKAVKRLYQNKLYDCTYPVKVITEMGGKNAVIVTANAELDETVSGILYSAFGHAGQKCSAASRVIVDQSIKERLIERLQEAGADIETSEAFKLSCTINPVISEEDRDRLRRQVYEATLEANENGGNVILDRSQEDLPGWCVGPVIIELPPQQALKEDSYSRTELFGPVLHIVSYSGLDHALEIFNCTDYALTGGVFGQSQDDIDYLTERMECGNIYVNRSITGARVAIEPFGGFKLSGTGPKAGGKAYIPQFHVRKTHYEEWDVDEVEGSDYQFDLCRPSLLNHRQRVSRLLKGMDYLLGNFESLFQGIHGEDKKLLSKFRKWCEKNLISFIEGEHQNRKIPGQLSFKDFQLHSEHGLVIGVSPRPEMDTIMQVLGALSMGVGVTVACRTQESYNWWGQFSLYFYQAGWSKDNFDVYIPTHQRLIETLKEPFISSIIIDGDSDYIEKIGQYFYPEDSSEKRMRQILTKYDTANPTDFKRICLSHVWVRSFAINTMRHGAPLELERL
jgi:RHH-type transcriptional regulator, proline utilization regulon repressor / proline dehydrogenase / delta 1-pyrroline-5-carboxylate dehydrogenase